MAIPPHTHRPTPPSSRDGLAAAAPRPFARLVSVLSDRSGGADLSPALRQLGPPSALDRLFRATLVAAVRRGPAVEREGWGPARLIGAAAEGASAGAVPAGTAPALRAVLEEIERRLHRAGLWQPAKPLWWRPLPRPEGAEEVWGALERAGRSGGAPPREDELTHRLAGLTSLAGPGGPGWLVARDALGAELLRTVQRELAALEPSGVLDLVRGGVGAEDRSTPARSDRVAYLTGLEPELLAAAPSVAVLVQWLLGRLTPAVARQLPGALHPPMSAMIARYTAPCRGFAAHLDNPGGEQDNGRAFTLVLYLNAPEAPCAGGELSLWSPGQPGPSGRQEIVPADGGSMALFDSRRVVHEVLPLGSGPDRWTVVVWLSDAARPATALPEPPELTPADVLEPLTGDLAIPAGTVVLRSLIDDADPASADLETGRRSEGAGPDGRDAPSSAGAGWSVRAVEPTAERPRVGVVCTTHRSGARLATWCRHHLDIGADHLLVVLDGASSVDTLEGARGIARRSNGRVTVWSAEEAERRWLEHDPREPARGGARPDRPEVAALLETARKGAATHAVAARQTLNATAALVAARRGAFGEARDGTRLDWLLHLDDDELFYPEGPARGGGSLGEHFAALAALRREEPSRYATVRYVNHELLLARRCRGSVRFKCNPLVAASRLGPVGWRRLVELLGMDQAGSRPYFRAYWNGKSAVAVDAGAAAAGVHGWRLEDAGTGSHSAVRAGHPLVAGPSVLHLHLPTRESFRRKYLAVALAASGEDRPFAPSPLEERAVGLIRELRGAGGRGAVAAELSARLDALYAEELCFDDQEVELLDAAGLLFTADLDLTAWTGAPECAAR